MDSQDTVRSLMFGVIIFMVGASVGAFVSYRYCSSVSYKAGFDTARDLVEGSSLGSLFRTPTDVRALSGTVTAIDGQKLTLHTVSNNPFDNSLLNDRTILVASSTKIVALVNKVSNGSQLSSSTPPTPFVITAIDFSLIKVGSTIIVTTLENVASMKEFTADGIRLQSQIPPQE